MAESFGFSPSADLLTLDGVMHHLPDGLKKRVKIQIFDEIGSTNTSLIAAAEHGSDEGTVFIASSQTGGKGRMGRRFFSPAGTGIYMSILVKPDIKPDGCVMLTPMAAVAAAEAIENITHRDDIKIKWVNDIYIGLKKSCGILTQASVSPSGRCLKYAVVGTGMNVYEPVGGFDESIKDTACAISKEIKIGLRNALSAEFIRYFFKYYDDIENKAFLSGYKERSCVIGRDVTVIRANRQLAATALDIDENCRLKVKYPSGEIEYLSTGEISLRLR